jgi:hypothetical protein
VRLNFRVRSPEAVSGGLIGEGGRHPAGVGTFVGRFWCVLDIAANGYSPLQYGSLGDYDYEDNGFDNDRKLHRLQFTFTLRRK